MKLLSLHSLTTGQKKIMLKNNSVADYLLICNHSAYYDNFSIPMRENKNFLLEMTDGLLIMTEKSSFKRNISSAPLHLLEKP